MSKILVTGGLGFVGSHLVDFLCEKNHEVTVIDNLCSESSSRDYMRSDMRYWIDDVRNLNSYKYENDNFDVVYHLAALARIQPSFKDPLTYLSIDIMGTSSVLEYARRRGTRVIYAGSSSAYAGPMLNPYAFAKYTGEQVCEMYHQVYGVPGNPFWGFKSFYAFAKQYIKVRQRKIGSMYVNDYSISLGEKGRKAVEMVFEKVGKSTHAIFVEDNFL